MSAESLQNMIREVKIDLNKTPWLYFKWKKNVRTKLSAIGHSQLNPGYQRLHEPPAVGRILRYNVYMAHVNRYVRFLADPDLSRRTSSA